MTRELWIQGEEDKNDDQYKRERGKVVIHEGDKCGDAATRCGREDETGRWMRREKGQGGDDVDGAVRHFCWR